MGNYLFKAKETKDDEDDNNANDKVDQVKFDMSNFIT